MSTRLTQEHMTTTTTMSQEDEHSTDSGTHDNNNNDEPERWALDWLRNTWQQQQKRSTIICLRLGSVFIYSIIIVMFIDKILSIFYHHYQCKHSHYRNSFGRPKKSKSIYNIFLFLHSSPNKKAWVKTWHWNQIFKIV
jgi:hypothetical protein